MEELTTAVIGCGNRAKSHGRAAVDGGLMRIKYACDIIRERAETGAEAWGATPCLDYRQVLADDSVQAVSIVTNVEAHLPIALDAIRAGKHIIVEKPLGDTVAQAREFVALAEASDRVCYVSFQLRFAAMNQVVKTHARTIDPVQVLFERQRGMMRPHFLDPSPFCGIMDVVAHDFDQVVWLMGRDPVAVTACVRRNTFTLDTDAADTCSALLDFGDQRAGIVFSSIGANEVGTRFDFVGSEGNLSFGSKQTPLGVHFQPCESDGEKESLSLESPAGGNPDSALQKAFVEEIRTGRHSEAARPRDGLNSLLVTLACLQSAREQRRVLLSEVTEPA